MSIEDYHLIDFASLVLKTKEMPIIFVSSTEFYEQR